MDGASDNQVVEFRDVTFSYDGKSNALDGVSLQVERGRLLCVLGGNGSGKSTLARHIDALLLPDGGEVRVLGLDTRDAQNLLAVRSSAGLVFQNPDDQIVASVVEDDVAFGPENLGVPSDELRTRVQKALAKVGLQGFAKRETTALSGGQKQRVAIAGACAMEPRIIVFDEASSMLDPGGRRGLMQLCRELIDGGITVVLITHFMEEAAEADCIVVLDEGRIAMEGVPGDVLTNARELAGLALDAPFATRMSLALQDAGVTVATCITEEQLLGELSVFFLDDDKDGHPNSRFAVRSAHALRSSHLLGPSGPKGENVSEEFSDHLCRHPLHEDPGDKSLVMPFASALSEQGPTSTRHFERAKRVEKSIAAEGRNLVKESPIITFENVSYSYAPKQARKRELNRNYDKCVGAGIARTKRIEVGSQVPKGNKAAWGGDGESPWALRDATFTLNARDFLGIAGHTGSGKSTLTQLAAGLLSPTQGRVLAYGKDLAKKRNVIAARSSIGMVFQYPEHQLFAKTVAEDIAFGPRNLGLPEDEVQERVRQALELVHLDPASISDRSPFELSGGQQRRVALAGVLAMQPSVLILDEPTAGLDPRAHDMFLELIAELHEGRNAATVIVSHNMDDLAALCNRIMLLNQGKIAADGAPSLIFSDEAAIRSIGLDVPHTVHLANQLGIADSFDGVPSIEQLASTIAAMCRAQGGAAR